MAFRQKTLDILDADLSNYRDSILNSPYKTRHKMFTLDDIRVDPDWSDNYYAKIDNLIKKYNLTWNEFEYSTRPMDVDNVIQSDKIGLYFFYVSPRNTIIGFPCYVMYVGIAGERNSGRPLRSRLKDYFNLNEIKKRTKVHTMLQLFFGHVRIKYTLFDGTSKELEELETWLHEFFQPRCNERDFEPPTKKARKAWK